MERIRLSLSVILPVKLECEIPTVNDTSDYYDNRWVIDRL